MMFDTADDRSLTERRAQATRDAVLEAAWRLSRDEGLTSWSLRQLAQSVGLKAPTLYAYFDSKHAIYDAMFRQGYEAFDAVTERFADRTPGPEEARRMFKEAVRASLQFSIEDPVRYQLMFQRLIPDFEPTPETYAVSVRQLDRLASMLASVGVTDPNAVDLWTAVSAGLSEQQLANDPGGDRWLRLADQACDMFCDHVGIPPEPEGNRS